MAPVTNEKVAQKFIEILKSGKLPPWARGWEKGYGFFPTNATTKRAYRGINIWILMATADVMEYRDSRWLTYKQAKDRGGHVKKGEKGTEIIFWNRFQDKASNSDPLAFDDKPKWRVISRLYTVFNVEQTEEVRLPEINIVEYDHEPLGVAEKVYEEMPKPPPILFWKKGFEDSPGYETDKDRVWMPEISRYEKPERYYQSLFHELGHATGHESRLNRPLHSRGDLWHRKEYAWEELIAEMSASMLCIHCQIDSDMSIVNSAAYLNSWIKTLEEDPGIIISAGQEAQKAYDYILEKEVEKFESD